MGDALPPTTPAPRRAVDLSPAALLRAGVSGVLAADLDLAASGRWTLATRAEDLAPEAVRILRPTDRSAIATVDIRGPLVQRAAFEVCGGYVDGYDAIEARFNRAVEVVREAGGGRVHVDVDSPGGVTAGGFSALRRMRALADRAGVKVVTTASEVATSMGFALLLLGDERHVPSRGTTASIGVLSVRRQSDDADKIEIFRSGERKARPNAVEPLNAEDRDDLQSRVDDVALEFAEWVSDRTGMSVDDILALRGAAMTGTQALEKGLITGNLTAYEVIDMATAEEIRASLAEAHGLPTTATIEQIKTKASELRGVEGRLSALEGALATAKAEQAREAAARMALEEQTAREKAQSEATAKRAAFAAEVKTACDAGLITPPREAALLAHYEAHGEASARGAFDMVKASAPIVKREKVGSIPASSTAAAALSDAQKEHARAIGVTETEYAVTVLGPAKEGA